MSAFLAVTKAAFDTLLVEKRGDGEARKAPFQEMQVGRELVYMKASPRVPGLQMRVFSSITMGEEVVRPVGSDAIRFVLVWAPKREGKWENQPEIVVKNFGQISRSGKSVKSLMKRVDARVVEMAELGAQMGVCKNCGAPTYAPWKGATEGNCIRRDCRFGR